MIREPILDVELIKSACADGDIDAVAELSSILVGNLSQRISATERGAYHLASSGEYLPDSLIGNFAYRMVRVLAKTNQSPPQDLANLFQVLLRQDRPPSRSDRKYMELLEARKYLMENPTAGIRQTATQVGVSQSVPDAFEFLQNIPLITQIVTQEVL